MVAILHHNQMDLLSIRAAAQASSDAFDYRMLGDRRLADGWRARAKDNIKAIELAQRIEQENRHATETEQGLMMKFIGFGASELANGLFEAEPRKGWEDIGKALTKAVSEAEMAELARCTQYAHYTPEFMVKAIWRGLKRMGFTGGKILEPSCFTPTTLIQTARGWIQMKDVILGDRVIGDDGLWHNVIRLVPKKSPGELVSLEIAAFPKAVEMTNDHELLSIPVHTCKSQQRPCHVPEKGLCRHLRSSGSKTGRYRCGEPWKGYKPSWNEAGSLKVGDYLVEAFDSSVVDIERIKIAEEARHGNLSGPSSIECDVALMRSIGIYLAEGCIDTNSVIFTFRRDETDMRDALEEAFSRYGWRINENEKDHDGAVDYRIHSRSLVKFFAQFGTSAATKRIPNWCMQLPAEKLSGLLWGVWRGDGNTTDYGFTAVSTVSINLALDVRNILYRFDIVPFVTQASFTEPKLLPSRERMSIRQTIQSVQISGGHLSSGSKLYGVDHPQIDRREFSLNKTGIVVGDKVFHKIRKVGIANWDGLVHDLTVEEAHSYGVGISTAHNCGTGLFWALMPEGISSRSTKLGYESDPTTARIARLLYPESDVVRMDFTKARIAYGFDLAIGNPPFARDQIIKNDLSEAGKLGLTIHDYFIARSIERLRAGGLAAFVTSRYTMDKRDDTARRHIARLANLVGAIRMPETAMRKDAGTDVCVDILFFQKRPDDELIEHMPSWVELGQSGVVIEGKPVWINQHFVDNPASVLGVHDQRTSQWGPIYTCKPQSDPLQQLLVNAINNLPVGIYEAVEEADDAPAVIVPTVRVGTAAQGARIKEGSYFIDTADRDARRAALYDKADRVSDKAERKAILKEAAAIGRELGILYQIIDSTPTEVAVKSGRGTQGIFGKSARVIRDMIPIREAVRDLLRAQEDDTSWDASQKRLNDAYDTFVQHHGPINDASITESPDKASKPLHDALTAFHSEEYELTGGADYATLRPEIRVVYDALKADFENVWGSLDSAEDRIVKRETVRYPNISAFRDDPDAYLVAAVEIYDQQTGEATKGPIFTQRVISPPAIMSIESPADAMAIVLNETGKVDMARIAELLNLTEAEAIANLRDLVYFDPDQRAWQAADEYLSGLVRDKLAAARKASATDPKLERNVVALEAVQPVDLLPSDITARLGAPWIPPEDIEAFSLEVIKVRTRVFHTPKVGVWSVNLSPFVGHATSTVDWGTKRRHAGEILLDALQNSTPVIYDEIEYPDGSTKRVQNSKETQAAQDKFAQMKQAFVDWIWTNTERADRLAKFYNQNFNNLVPRKFSGEHLVLPGASNVIELNPHQKRAVWGMICGKIRYLAHAVGSGKTYSDIAGIMEQRRLGLIKKPIVVVPNHTLAQWAREWLLLYPNAKILVADEENFGKNKRVRFVARASVGDWDAIIITHSAFEYIAAPFEFEQSLIEDQISAIDDAQKALDKEDRLGVKKLNALKERMKRKLDGLKAKKDDCVTISEMGVDSISVDEAHEYRKLSFFTSLSTLKGVDPQGSDMSWDLFVKGRFLQQTNPNRALTMLSGTPIVNTMGEMYSLLRYLNISGLVERGVELFDPWISTFGESKTELELQPSGAYKAVTRLSEFVNIPELSAMFLDVADVVLSDDLAQFVKLPLLRVNSSGKREREVLTFEGGPSFRQYQKVLAKRIKAIEERGGRPEKGDDIILTVIGDGRHAAIDMRLVNPVRDLAIATGNASEDMRDRGDRHDLDTADLRLAHQNNPANKLNGLIDNAFQIWHDTADKRYVNPATGELYALPGASQMIFCDLGTEAAEEKRGFSVYTWIRRRLIELGVPQDQIAIMQHYKKMLAKQRLFNDVNSGRVRFLIGSSQTMGTGVNAQQRLVALHHLDAPYLPALIGQREGRILRQGNQNEEVGVYVYSTLGSMDATMWQILERKQRFIDAVLRGDKSVRRLADLEASEGDQFAMAKAMASGDTRLLQKAGLEQEIARLTRRRSAHFDAQSNIQREIRFAHERIETATARLDLLLKDMKTRAIPMPETFKMTVEGIEYPRPKGAGDALMKAINTEYPSLKEAGDALMKAINTALLVDGDKPDWLLAEYGGFRLEAATWIKTNIATGTKEKVCFAWLITAASRIRVFEMDLKTGDAIIHRMEAALNDFEHHAIDAQSAIASAHDTINDYTKRLGGKFDLQAELDEKRAQLAEIEASLAPKVEEKKEEEMEEKVAA